MDEKIIKEHLDYFAVSSKQTGDALSLSFTLPQTLLHEPKNKTSIRISHNYPYHQEAIDIKIMEELEKFKSEGKIQLGPLYYHTDRLITTLKTPGSSHNKILTGQVIIRNSTPYELGSNSLISQGQFIELSDRLCNLPYNKYAAPFLLMANFSLKGPNIFNKSLHEDVFYSELIDKHYS